MKPCRTRPAHAPQGFSLLETLVAFSILSLCVGVLSQIHGRGAQLMHTSKEHAEAVHAARSVMARIGTEHETKPGSLMFEVKKYRFLVRIEEFQDTTRDETLGEVEQNPELRLYQVTMDVSWNRNGKQDGFTLTTMRLAPAT